MNYFFPTTNSNVFLCVTCRKISDMTNNQSDLFTKYLAYQYQQSNFVNSQTFKPATNETPYINTSMLNVLSQIDNIEDDMINIVKIELTQTEIDDGSGSFDIEELFSSFIAEKGDGEYIIQYFFTDDSDNKIVSLPSDIYILNFLTE